MTSLPWNDPNSNPLRDIQDHIRFLRDEFYSLQPWEGKKVSKTIAIVSGGLDSTTMIYHLIHEGAISNENTLDLVSFDYGQRHKKELQYAKAIARQLGLRHDIVDLTALTHLISNSALTSATTVPATGSTFDVIEVPDGHYAEETMKATVVPNRNMIMLSIAAGIAVNRGASTIATAVHAGDHFIYPDCRPAFIESCSYTIAKANEGFSNFKTDPTGTYDAPLVAPFINWSKADIAFHAMELGVPLHLTWSCYKGGENHCGRCGTCVERLEAIDEARQRVLANNAKVISGAGGGPITKFSRTWDETTYDDVEFWRTAVKGASK